MSHASTVGSTGSRTPEIDALARRVRGPVLLPGDDGYDVERTGFQTAVEQRPALVVGAEGAEDVRAAVEFASANGLPVGVRATGHGACPVAEGGLLITTRRMTGVRVDAEGRTAWLDAGVCWDQVIPETSRHGLAPLSGSAPHVGAVSYTLGGGLGLLARRYGYAADHVRAVEVVTADGALRQVTAETDPDLFWALRGGRDNFGVVTRLQVDLFPVTRLYGGGLFFDAEHVRDVLPAYRDWTATVPDELTSSVGMVPLPDLPVVPEPLRGRHVLHLRVAHTGDAAGGERLVAPLREVAPRLMDTLRDMPFAEAGSIYNDPTTPHGYHGNNVLLRELDGSALDAVLQEAGPGASVPCVVDIRHLGGALARPPAVPNAVGHREARYILRVLSPVSGADVERVRAVHRRVFDAAAPWTIGRSLNFVYGENAPEQVRSCYQPAEYRRLAELKAAYDPKNTFRRNHNIPPA
jgi:FAD/FMN-containing dehydrogenase